MLRSLQIAFSITTGTLSLIGSCLLICTILRSKKKLTLPYRRIIFGTSIYDVFQSLGMSTSVFLSPKEIEPPIQFAIGTATTCDIQGFFTTIGAIGVPIYLCSLCIYYFCIIRLNMRDHTFKKIEPFFHAVPILYSLIVGAYAFSKQYFNNAGSVCYVAPSPITCKILPSVECNRGEGATDFRKMFLTVPSMIIFIIVCSTMAIISYSVVKQERRQSPYSFHRPSSEASISENIPEGERDSPSGVLYLWKILQSVGSRVTDVLFCTSSSERNHNDIDDNTTPEEKDCSSQPSGKSMAAASTTSVSNQRRSSSTSHPTTVTISSTRSSRSRTREIMTQALLYVGCYILSYGFVWASTIYQLATKLPPPTVLLVFSSIFFPLQGFLNVFIYCRPHIISLRRSCPGEYSWFQAFLRVLKSGGDDPLTRQERQARLRASSNMTFSQQSIAQKRPSILTSVNCSDADSHSMADMMHKTEMCERRSSLTSRTGVEDLSVEVSHQFKNSKKLISTSITIPGGDAEQAPSANVPVSSTDCDLCE